MADYLNNVWVTWRNAANTSDYNVIKLGSDHEVYVRAPTGEAVNVGANNTYPLEVTEFGVAVTGTFTATGLRECLSAHGNTSTTETVDLAAGTVHTATLDANCTFTFTGTAASVACSFTLIVKQDGTGNRTATWPASVDWPGGVAPTLSTAANAVDILVFTTVDNGTTWYGNMAGKGYA